MNWKSSYFKAFVWLLILLSGVMIGSCKKEHCLDCMKGSGEKVWETRSLGSFSGIKLSDRINLFVIQDSTDRVIVEGGENLVPYIVTEISDGELTIRDDNRCNWVRSFKKEINVYLHCRSLREISYSGAGDIESLSPLSVDTLELNFWDGSGCIKMNVNCQMLKVHCHTGCGDAEISGTAANAYYYTRSNGAIRCKDLKAEHVIMDVKGTNDSYVWASQSISAYIGYTGNVYYAGHPAEVSSVITERGRLIPLD
jgi:hypothetical protein